MTPPPTPARLARATTVLRERAPRLTDEELLDALAEVGLEEAGHYDEHGRLQLHLSDLQVIAAAAAIAAVVEATDANIVEIVA